MAKQSPSQDQEPRRSFYAVIPADVLYDSRLKPNEKLLYAQITGLTSSEGYCWATNEYLAKLFTCGGKQVNAKTVSAWIAHLKECGHIKTQIVSKNGVVIGRHIYIKSALPTIPDTADIGDSPYPQKNGYDSIKSGNPYPQKNGIEYIHPITNTPSVQGDVLFDRFWAAWPRKDGKKQALAAWRKAQIKPELLDKILAAIERQSIALRWTPERRQYIPLPATWINGERWNDEVSAQHSQQESTQAPQAPAERRFRIT